MDSDFEHFVEGCFLSIFRSLCTRSFFMSFLLVAGIGPRGACWVCVPILPQPNGSMANSLFAHPLCLVT